MMAGRYAYDGTPGTYERGRIERARQDAMIEAAGGIENYCRGARPMDKQKHVDGGVLDVVQYNQPRDTSGDKMSA